MEKNESTFAILFVVVVVVAAVFRLLAVKTVQLNFSRSGALANQKAPFDISG